MQSLHVLQQSGGLLVVPPILDGGPRTWRRATTSESWPDSVVEYSEAYDKY